LIETQGMRPQARMLRSELPQCQFVKLLINKEKPVPANRAG
jgi:hypothetical protein